MAKDSPTVNTNEERESRKESKRKPRTSSESSANTTSSRSHSSSGSEGSSSSSGSSSRSSSSESTDSSRSPRRRTSPKRSEAKKSRTRSQSPRRRKRSPTPKPTKVHIGALTRNITKDHVQEIFATYGSVKDVVMYMDTLHPHLNRGDAYVEFEKPEEAQLALKHMDGGQIDGKEVAVSLVIQRQPARNYAQERAQNRYGRFPPRQNWFPRSRRSPPRRRRTPPRRSRSPRRRRERYSRSSSSSSH